MREGHRTHISVITISKQGGLEAGSEVTYLVRAMIGKCVACGGMTDCSSDPCY